MPAVSAGGGLYLYFESTAELFREVLEAEQKEKDDIFSGEIPEDATATDILLVFLKEQKKEILLKKNSITVAAYEYFLQINPPKRITCSAGNFWSPWISSKD